MVLDQLSNEDISKLKKELSKYNFVFDDFGTFGGFKFTSPRAKIVYTPFIYDNNIFLMVHEIPDSEYTQPKYEYLSFSNIEKLIAYIHVLGKIYPKILNVQIDNIEYDNANIENIDCSDKLRLDYPNLKWNDIIYNLDIDVLECKKGDLYIEIIKAKGVDIYYLVYYFYDKSIDYDNFKFKCFNYDGLCDMINQILKHLNIKK